MSRQLASRGFGALAVGLLVGFAGTWAVHRGFAEPSPVGTNAPAKRLASAAPAEGSDPAPARLEFEPIRAPAAVGDEDQPSPPTAAVQVVGSGDRPAARPGVPAPDPGLPELPVPLRRPLETPVEEKAPPLPADADEAAPLYCAPVDAPLGYTGPSGIEPQEEQDDPHFVPMPDRWRVGFPESDRYGQGFPANVDYPYQVGHWWDPYNLNVLKGDYPILGQHTFFVLTGSLQAIAEERQVPTPTTPFESTANPFSQPFFGKPNQFFTTNFLSLSLELFHGDAAFRPVDWRVKLTPVFNFNYLAVDELGIVNPDVTRGTTRGRTFFTLQEWFIESKLADLSPDYDFLSVRLGSQPFTSDFRGFIFSDTNRAVRLFGTRLANRDEFNLAYFQQLEKDTNSMLNSFHDRHQGVLIANYYRQDCIWPGYTAQLSVHYDHDSPTFRFDNNNFLVRPDPVGVFKPHTLDVAYLGWAGEGHINRFNISHAFYWALGYDTLNPMANQAQDINAQMAALEVSYDRDWVRFRTSFFWASGDENPNNKHATGFDAIFDNPNFAGGNFSYWQRQTIRLFGVNLTNRESLLPDLRSSKVQGQANFVNPGLYLVNFGMDFDVTPKFRVISNVNLLWFDSTNVLKQFVFQSHINQYIGADLSLGCEYRPLLSNNVILRLGLATLIPGAGFKDLYDNLRSDTNPLLAGFAEAVLTF